MEITRRDIETVTSARTKEQLFLYLKSKLSEQEQLDFIAESKDYIHQRYSTWIRDLVVCEGVDYHNLPAKRVSNRFPSERVIYDCIDPDGFAEDIIDDFAKFLRKQLIVQKECLLFTNRDADICQKSTS